MSVLVFEPAVKILIRVYFVLYIVDVSCPVKELVDLKTEIINDIVLNVIIYVVHIILSIHKP